MRHRFSYSTLLCMSTLLLGLSLSAAAQTNLHFVIPGGAGGGWDRTARVVGQVLEETQLITRATFVNLSGGGGAKGIAHTIELGDPNLILVNSTPIVVRSLQKYLPQTFRDLAPIASVIGDYSVVAVRKQSPYHSLQALMQDMQSNPRSLPIAGGSVVGGTDHIFAALLARSFAINPKGIKYIPYDAGGKAMAGLLSGEVAALSSGYGEVVDLAEQGWVRVLCIAAPEPLEGISIPTCQAEGATDLEFVNWRGFFMAPTVEPARQAEVAAIIEAMTQTAAWDEARKRYGWAALYKNPPAFQNMLETQAQTLAVLLVELGLMDEGLNH